MDDRQMSGAITPLMTARDVAGQLKVSVQTVRRWAASGELRAVRIGRGIRFNEEDVREFIERPNGGAAA